MGAYLSEPMREKESEEGAGNGLRFGASSMQGWRNSQEDAHNCLAEFDDKSSLFGVFDGHGGAEVALYVAKHFPEVLKGTEAYQEGDIEKAFIQAYLRIDQSIKEPEVLVQIQQLAKRANLSQSSENEDEGQAGFVMEENVAELYEEATMPLDQLVAKYKQRGEGEGDEKTGEEKPCSSSSVSPSKSKSAGPSPSSASAAATSPSSAANSSSSAAGASSSSSTNDSEVEVKVNGVSEKEKEEKKDEADSSTAVNGNGEVLKVEMDGHGSSVELSSEDKKDESKKDEVDATASGETPSPSKARKGKVQPSSAPIFSEAQRRSIRTAVLAGLAAFTNGDSSDSDLDSSDEDAMENESDCEDEEDEDSDEAGEEEDDSDDDEEEEDDTFLSGLQEPGYDSGTTAVCTFLRWEGEKLHVWVANAGDSRCVVSRSGIAVDMSYDHKPESEEETLRIIKAGGKVTDDGRVNGGLNLSRALGDHSYKQNESLTPEEQMISPLPCVQHLELTPKVGEDEFLVIACDGVWNSMTSQQVIDFIKERIHKETNLSKICEELFDYCLAPDTKGDGTGCDNMTAIIVQFSPSQGKREHSKEDEEVAVQPSSKRQKLNEEVV